MEGREKEEEWKDDARDGRMEGMEGDGRMVGTDAKWAQHPLFQIRVVQASLKVQPFIAHSPTSAWDNQHFVFPCMHFWCM